MNDYYNDMLKQYQQKFAPQKTPQQIAEDQEIQAYQKFLATKEGIEAVGELRTKFDNWLSANYGAKNSSKEVSELKEMMAKMAAQIENLTNQLK